MKSPKQRLDVLLVERGLFPSREAARRAIMAGLVKQESGVLDKPGTQVSTDIQVTVVEPLHPYVSRGGLKLKQAIDTFHIDFSDRVVLDVGASTGGFTDCALQHGAKHVFALDVGYGQLAWKLRNDDRVTVLERTNFRHVDKAQFIPEPTTAVMDVSFISVKLLFPKLLEVLKEPSEIVSLVKPQFEAGRADVGKGGIVRDRNVHIRVLREHCQMATVLGLGLGGLTYSPITGGDGNIEYLAWWKSSDGAKSGMITEFNEAMDERIQSVVEEAWAALSRLN